MIDGIGTSPVQSTSARAAAQAEVVASASAPSESSQDFVASRIRLDNLQNVAILEYRNGEGEVVRQYPTEKQIEAFKRAQALEEAQRAQSHEAAAAHAHSAQLLRQETAHAAPAPKAAPVAVQHAEAPAAQSSAPAPAPSGDSGQSVVV